MKPIKVTNRKPWEQDEIIAMLELYDYFLSCQRSGTDYSKALPVRRLAATIGRSKGSIEAKMMNVSAVRHAMNLDYVNGYKPLGHGQKLLVQLVMNRTFIQVKTA